jgi:hypothetical protein
MINSLIEERKQLSIKHKEKMDNAQKRIDEASKYDLTELLNANCAMNFHKGCYMALTREIKDLEQLKEKIINSSKILSNKTPLTLFVEEIIGE